MGFLKKYKKEVIIALGLVTLYLLLRLPVITQLPIFTDEAIYLRWAQIAKNDANWRFISLTDGKQPLFIWLVMIVMRFVSDPLVAGRLVSLGAGLTTMVGLFLLGREIFKNRWIGLISAGLYAILPFALVYDRLAVYDSLVSTFAVWGLYMTVKLVRSLRLDHALIMGFITGAAVLNKTNGFFTVYLLPFSLLLFDFKQKDIKSRLLRFIGLAGVVVVMTYGFYTILRLSPFFYIIAQKNAIFVYPLSEWIKHPFTYLFSNLSALIDWYMHYIGLPVTVLALAAFIAGKSFMREKLLLILFFVLPFAALAVMGNTIYPRYIFFMTLSLLPLTAYTLVALSKRLSKPMFLTVVVLTLLYWGVADFFLVTNFVKAPIPQADKSQYLTGWPAGVGVKEATDFFAQQAEKEPIHVETAGTFGLMPYALELAFVDNKDITVKGFWPVENTPSPKLLAIAKTKPTYVLFYQECPACPGSGLAPLGWPVEKVLQVERIEKESYLTVYRLLPQ